MLRSTVTGNEVFLALKHSHKSLQVSPQGTIDPIASWSEADLADLEAEQT